MELLKTDGGFVSVDVTDADAGALNIYGRKAQVAFALRVAGAVMDRWDNDESRVFYLRGKRGVSNRGFKALVDMKER